MRVILKLLRWFRPILLLPPRRPVFAFVTRHLDVVEVLRRNDVFSVAIYDDKMKATTGAFFLGFGPTKEYDRERGIVDRALRHDDLPRIREFLTTEAHSLVDAAATSGGRIDVVTQLANILPVRFVEDYYGVTSPGDGTLLRWFQDTSRYLFWFATWPASQIAAVRAGAEARAHLHRVIAERRALLQSGMGGPDDLLGRLLKMQTDPTQENFDDDGVARTLAGLASGSIIPPVGIFVNAVDRLMKLPDDDRQALQRAARDGNDDMLAQYLREAERFGPYPPFVYRYCEQDCVLAEGTARQTAIPAGTTVVVSLASAADDSEALDEPGKFLPGRPPWQYPQFGYGQHACLGSNLSKEMATAMAKALFGLKGLRRAHGRAGRVQTMPLFDGGYPSHFVLEFDAAH